MPDLLVLPDTRKTEQRRRLLGAVAAISVMALGGLGVLLFTGKDNEGTNRTTGDLSSTTTVAQSSTTVATQVAGAVEQRPAETIAVPVAVAPTRALATSAVTTSNEVRVIPPTTPPTVPPTVAPTRPPTTVPPTVAPTLAPTTVPPTVPPTVAPATTQSNTTTTRPPATSTTRRRGILGL